MVEAIDGTVLPIEAQFRGRIDREDWTGLRGFMQRYNAPWGILITRDTLR